MTGISAAGTFYPAEDYHQDYYLKNPLRYKFYRYGCGRDQHLEELWGKPEQAPDACPQGQYQCLKKNSIVGFWCCRCSLRSYQATATSETPAMISTVATIIASSGGNITSRMPVRIRIILRSCHAPDKVAYTLLVSGRLVAMQGTHGA